MKRFASILLAGWVGVSVVQVQGAVLTVTTTNNAAPGAGISLDQALRTAVDGDEIRFNLPGPGPHYIRTPDEGYPEIKAHRLLIDGYSQPGSSPNTNPILASNNAQIRVYLDSRAGGRRVLDMDGYGPSEAAILGVVGATNVTIRGLGFLGRIAEGTVQDPALYCVSFAAKATGGHVSGCWFGVDADRTSVFGANAGITGFRFQEDGQSFLVDNTVIGLKPNTSTPRSEFNVFAGLTIPIIIEGANLRVSGNFLNVLPSGTNEFNNPVAGFPGEAVVQVGRNAANTVIGTDGDGVNDAEERNIIGGLIPRSISPLGYNHLIEFYGGPEFRTNIVIAGNYIGIGVDGQTRFTNGVPIVSGLTGSARIGSDLDGVSDSLEGNLIYNNYPPSLFPPGALVPGFLASLGVEADVSVRANRLVNNFTPPVDPLRDEGFFIFAYYSRALAAFDLGFAPLLATNTTVTRLFGRVPESDRERYPHTIVDLYLVDPEGIATGIAAGIPELPEGFLQGRTYLGSFEEGSAADRDPLPDAFSFNIAHLNLPVGAQLTVTANFSKQPPGTRNAETLTSLFSSVVTAREGAVEPTEPPTLRFARRGNAVTLSWEEAGFVLQSAPSVLGPWTSEVTTGNQFTAEVTAPARFFRLVSR